MGNGLVALPRENEKGREDGAAGLDVEADGDEDADKHEEGDCTDDDGPGCVMERGDEIAEGGLDDICVSRGALADDHHAVVYERGREGVIAFAQRGLEKDACDGEGVFVGVDLGEVDEGVEAAMG